jgi:hypothetical protein
LQEALTIGTIMSWVAAGSEPVPLTSLQIDAGEASKILQKRLAGQVFTVGQRASFEFRGSNFVFTVTETVPVGALDDNKSTVSMTRGLLSPETTFFFESGNSSIKVSMTCRCFVRRKVQVSCFQVVAVGRVMY